MVSPHGDLLGGERQAGGDQGEAPGDPDRRLGGRAAADRRSSGRETAPASLPPLAPGRRRPLESPHLFPLPPRGPRAAARRTSRAPARLPAADRHGHRPVGLPPSPVKRIEVQPAGRTITAGDSVRLTLRALDESGRPVPNAVLAVKMLGGQGEGAMRDTTMWLVASSVGKFPLALIALVPGTEPFVDSTSVEFLGVPGPSVRVEVAPTPPRSSRAVAPAQRDPLLQGQRPGAGYGALAEQRVRVASVDRDGIITGHAAGTARVTASVRGVESTEVRGARRRRSGASRSRPRGPPCARATWCRSRSRRATRRARRSRGSRRPGASPPATGSSMPTAGSWPIARGRTP